MIYINGVPFFGSLHIDGLVNVDQHFDPKSENPQSGLAVAEAVAGKSDAVVFLSSEEASYEQIKELADSGKEVVIYTDEDSERQYYTLAAVSENFYSFVHQTAQTVKRIHIYTDHMSSSETKLISQDDVQQHFYPGDARPLSGAAVDKAIAGIQRDSLKMHWDLYTVPENGICSISLVRDENKPYTVYGVFMTTLSGEILMCDVGVYDYTCSGGSGVCEIKLSFSEPPDEAISVRILYKEE